jgi:hypothetical protein
MSHFQVISQAPRFIPFHFKAFGLPETPSGVNPGGESDVWGALITGQNRRGAAEAIHAFLVDSESSQWTMREARPRVRV